MNNRWGDFCRKEGPHTRRRLQLWRARWLCTIARCSRRGARPLALNKGRNLYWLWWLPAASQCLSLMTRLARRGPARPGEQDRSLMCARCRATRPEDCQRGRNLPTSGRTDQFRGEENYNSKINQKMARDSALLVKQHLQNSSSATASVFRGRRKSDAALLETGLEEPERLIQGPILHSSGSRECAANFRQPSTRTSRRA